MIYTPEQLKEIISPMVAAAVHDALDDKPIHTVVDNVTNAIIEVIKQDREAHAANTTTLAADND